MQTPITAAGVMMRGIDTSMRFVFSERTSGSPVGANHGIASLQMSGGRMNLSFARVFLLVRNARLFVSFDLRDFRIVHDAEAQTRNFLADKIEPIGWRLGVMLRHGVSFLLQRHLFGPDQGPPMSSGGLRSAARNDSRKEALLCRDAISGA